MAIRAALGASRERLRHAVLADGVRIATFGSLFGIVGALAFGRGVSSLLVDVRPHDPVAIEGAALLAVASAVVGCLLPAQHAAAANLAEALKE